MMTGWKWIATTSLLAGAIALAACGGSKPESAEQAESSSGGEPEIVIADQAEWDSLLASGQEVFDTHCENCHPGGEADRGPKLKGHAVPVAEATHTIRKGEGKMPAFGENKISEVELKGLLVFLASIDAVDGVKAP